MQQMIFPELKDQLVIKGLHYIEHYITPQEEEELIKTIDHQGWIYDLKRRVQHYGYKYNYQNKTITKNSYLGLLPKWLNFLCARLIDDAILDYLPDQIIVNKYLPGQGLAAHIDCISCFGPVICSLSLGSDCVMDFCKETKISKTLERRSLLILSDYARYQWKHGIVSRKTDQYLGTQIHRKRRISITFRHVNQ